MIKLKNKKVSCASMLKVWIVLESVITKCKIVNLDEIL